MEKLRLALLASYYNPISKRILRNAVNLVTAGCGPAILESELPHVLLATDISHQEVPDNVKFKKMCIRDMPMGYSFHCRFTLSHLADRIDIIESLLSKFRILYLEEIGSYEYAAENAYIEQWRKLARVQFPTFAGDEIIEYLMQKRLSFRVYVNTPKVSGNLHALGIESVISRAPLLSRLVPKGLVNKLRKLDNVSYFTVYSIIVSVGHIVPVASPTHRT